MLGHYHVWSGFDWGSDVRMSGPLFDLALGPTIFFRLGSWSDFPRLVDGPQRPKGWASHLLRLHHLSAMAEVTQSG